jgi:ferredoxin--NADP+ reductase
MAEAPNPKIAAANEMLKKKMATATLIHKEVFAGGRLGTFIIKPDAGDRWAYAAGQYTTLGLDTPTGFVPRAYSIAGSPLDGGVLEFYIALVEGGALTPTIFQTEVGGTFRYLSPKGKFTLTQANANGPKQRLVMVATGTGLAPFVGQLRTLWKAHQAGVPNPYQIVLFHGAAYADEFGYASELEQYAADAAFGLTYLKTSSRPDASRGWTPAIAKGRVNEVVRLVLGQPNAPGRTIEMPAGIDAAAVRERIAPAGNAAATAFLACGNPGMIEDIKEPIHAIGCPTYLVEEFWKA